MCFNNILFEHTETRMNKKIKNPETDHLFQAILTLKNLDECYAFFEDICTFKEIDAMGARLEAAKLLDKGNTYEEILKKINISYSTLSRVSKAFKYGTGGYKLIIDRLEKDK